MDNNNANAVHRAPDTQQALNISEALNVPGASAVPNFADLFWKIAQQYTASPTVQALCERRKQGGRAAELYSVNCATEFAPDYEEYLAKRKVPYIPVVTNEAWKSYLISGKDKEDAEIMLHTLYDKYSREALLADSLQFEDMQSHTEEKNVVSFSGIHDAQTGVILQQFMQAAKGGIRVGQEKTGDKWKLVVPESQAFRSGAGNACLARDMAQAILKMNGPLSGIYKRRYDKNASVEIQAQKDGFIHLLTNPSSEVFLVDPDNHHTYVRFSKEGFQYFTITKRMKNGRAVFARNPGELVRFDSPQYNRKLQDMMLRMDNKVVTLKWDHVKAHCFTPSQSPIRSSLSKGQKIQQKGENEIIRKVDRMVSKRVRGMKRLQNEADKAVLADAYLKETAVLLKGIREDTMPFGYAQEDFDTLKKMFRGFHLSPDTYRMAETDLDEIQAATSLARTLTRDTRSIGEKLAEHKNQPSYEELLERAEAQMGKNMMPQQ